MLNPRFDLIHSYLPQGSRVDPFELLEHVRVWTNMRRHYRVVVQSSIWAQAIECNTLKISCMHTNVEKSTLPSYIGRFVA